MNLPHFEFSIEKYEDKIDLVRRYQKYIFLGSIILIIFYFFSVFIRPELQVIIKKNNELKQYVDIFERKRNSISEKKQIQKQIAALRKKLLAIKNSFFEKKEVGEFSIDTLPKLAVSNRISIHSIKYGTKTEIKENIFVLPMNIVAVGTLEPLFSFVDTLESYHRVIKIISINFKVKSMKPYQIESQISLEAYFMKS